MGIRIQIGTSHRPILLYIFLPLWRLSHSLPEILIAHNQERDEVGVNVRSNVIIGWEDITKWSDERFNETIGFSRSPDVHSRRSVLLGSSGRLKLCESA